MSEPSLFGDLYLDAVAFRLAAPLVVQQLSTYPGKITTGDYTKDSDPRLSSWIISDLSGGHGVRDIREGVDQNRCRWATLNTRYPGQFAPPYTATQYTAASDTNGAKPLGDLYESGTYKFYAAYGQKLVRWDESSLAFSASLGTLTAVPVNKAVEFVGTGSRLLFIPMGASGYATWSGAAFANVAAGGAVPGVQAFTLWDNKLVALSTAGHLWYSTDGTTWTDWNATSVLATVDASMIPRNLVTFYDQGSNPTIFVVTNRGALAFDPNGPRLYHVEALDWPPHPYQALGSAKWRSHFYSTIGMGVRRYTGEIVQPMGLDRDEGLPPNYRGRVLDLEPESNGLYALCLGGEVTTTSYPHLQVWTDFGWHTVWAETTARTTTKTTWSRISEAQGMHRIWWGDGTGNLKTIALPVDDANPRAQLLASGGTFSADGNSVLETGIFDAGMVGIDKVASHLFVKVLGSGTTGALLVDYRINGETNWTALGTQSFAGGDRSAVFSAFGDQLTHFSSTGDYEGLLFQEIEFRFTLTDSACWIDHAAFYFMKVMPPGRAFSTSVDLTVGNFDQSPEDLAQKLDDLMNDGLFFEMQYRHTGPGAAPVAADYIRVKLTGVDGTDGTGEDTRGVRSLTILEVPQSLSLPEAQVAQVPDFVAVASANGSGTTLTINKPTGTVDNDLLVATIAWHNNVGGTRDITPPAGWTTHEDSNPASAGVASFSKVASSEGASWDWTLSEAATWAGVVAAFTDTAASSPYIDSTANSEVTTSTPTASSLTTATQNALIVASSATNNSRTYTAPADMVSLYSRTTDPSLMMAMLVQGSAGATGNKVFTLSASVSNCASHLLGFKAEGT